MKNFIAANFTTLVDYIKEKDQNDIRVLFEFAFSKRLFKNKDSKMCNLKT